MSISFLTLDEVVAIHAHQIGRYCGSPAIRDVRLLESALAMPQATFYGEDLHPTVLEKAAAYLFHVVKNHPFVDGNERTGLAVCLSFLRLNGQCVRATDDELVALIVGVAKGDLGKPDVAVFLKAHRAPPPPTKKRRKVSPRPYAAARAKNSACSPAFCVSDAARSTSTPRDSTRRSARERRARARHKARRCVPNRCRRRAWRARDTRRSLPEESGAAAPNRSPNRHRLEGCFHAEPQGRPSSQPMQARERRGVA